MKPRRRPVAISLTARVVVGYAATSALVLSLAAFYLLRGMATAFLIEDSGLLSDQVEHVRQLLLAEADGLRSAVERIEAMAGARNIERYFGRLLDEHSAVIAVTPGFEIVAPSPELYDRICPASRTRSQAVEWTQPDGALSFLISQPVRASPESDLTWTFQVALDAEHVSTWLAGYRRELQIVVVGGSLLTAGLGLVIARRGLRPLSEITATLHRITANHMSNRLGETGWPPELSVLASEFDKMLDRLEGAFERVSQFSADAAHELRTPLNNLMGGTSLALAKPRSESEYRAVLERNLEEFEQLRRIVDCLLFIARAENTEIELQIETCDALAIAADVCDYYSALAEERGVRLLAQGQGTADADKTLLRLALTNLVSNALRHTLRDGSVVLTIARSDLGGCEITVSDTGCGISEEHLSRIFDPFYRIRAARERDEGNLGLGLALVRTILSLHGGQVTAESTLGCGSTFRVFIPDRPRSPK